MSKKPADQTAALAVVKALRGGLESKKCRRCGNMANAFDRAEKAFSSSDNPEVSGLAGTVRELRGDLEKQAFENAGCGGCTGDRIKKLLAASFPKAKKSRNDPSIADAPLKRFLVESLLDPPRVQCTRLNKKGRPVGVVVGEDADAVIVAVLEGKLVKKAAEAAWLGAALARAEAQAKT